MATFSRSTTGKEVVAACTNRVSGLTIVITGASTGGLGAETALSLAYGKPSHLLLLGRDAKKIEPVVQEIRTISADTKVSIVSIDLSNQASVRQAAALIKQQTKSLDVLINNAAIMALPQMEKTSEGIEAQFGTNHIGHFLLTALLMDCFRKSAPGARVVNVTSTAYFMSEVRFDDYNFNDGAEYDAWKAYAQSKTANLLFTLALARRSDLHHGAVTAFAAHPGLIPTNLTRHTNTAAFSEAWKLTQEREKILGLKFPSESGKSIQQGCATILVAALDPSIANRSGAVLRDCEIQNDIPSYAASEKNAERLWALSEELVHGKFP